MNHKSIENQTQKILNELSLQFSVAKEVNIREQLSSEIETEQINIHKYLKRDNPFKENQLALQFAENELKIKNIATIDMLEQDFQHFQALANQT